jgi:predicted dienelactone hydrolase
MLIDPDRSDLWDAGRGRPIRVYEWSSAAADSSPVVVLSHGTGGSGRDLGWLAQPLVRAGFRVVSLDHHGNNNVDGYHPAGFICGWDRPRDATFVLDAMFPDALEVGVGVAGFSFGGYTAAALAGARLDGKIVEGILTGEVPIPPIEEFPQALDRWRESITVPLSSIAAEASADLRDSRVSAAFLIAPGLGALTTRESLATITVPMAIRWGDRDVTNPYERDIKPYLDHVPTAIGREIGPGVDHHDFIAALTPTRNSARDQIAEDAVLFFTEHLLQPAAPQRETAADTAETSAGQPPFSTTFGV